jgi:hypothetical protein
MEGKTRRKAGFVMVAIAGGKWYNGIGLVSF